MSSAIAFILMVVSLLLAGFSGWRGSRPASPMRGPRLIPWRLLMALFTLAAVVLLVHGVRMAINGG